MTQRYYNIDYAKLALLLLPTELRKPLISAYAISAVRPLDLLHEEFMQWANALETEPKAQVCYMRGLLNDEFDYYDRRILVRVSPIDFDYYLCWMESQNKPVMLWGEDTEDGTPYLLSKDGYIGSTNTDFDVVFPKGHTLSSEENIRIRSIINQHKLASKTYRIIHE